jgi:hypothetical protein
VDSVSSAFSQFKGSLDEMQITAEERSRNNENLRRRLQTMKSDLDGEMAGVMNKILNMAGI